MNAWICSFSERVAKVEIAAVIVLTGLIPALVITNVLSRIAKMPIYWIDEASILAMIWLALIGTSLSIKKRDSLSVELLAELVENRMVAIMVLVLSDISAILFGSIFLVLCYIWFDPVLLYSVGFDFAEFSSVSFNFVYEEQTQTMSIAKFWFWLVLPVIGTTITLHGVANLAEVIRTRGRRQAPSAISNSELEIERGRMQ